MSNLTRKIKKAFESPEKAAQRSRRRYQRRLQAQQPPGFPWPPLREARVRAAEDLPEEIRKKCTNDMGVFDLDKLSYKLTLRYEPGTPRKPGVKYDGTTAGGWWPEVTAEFRDDA